MNSLITRCFTYKNFIFYRIQAAAAEQLEGLKEMSALGLEYAIEKHSVLDIQV